MSPIPSFDYNLLYQERVIRSVANNTRKDGEDFLRVAAEIPIHSQTTLFPLRDANRALNDLKERPHQWRRGSGLPPMKIISLNVGLPRTVPVCPWPDVLTSIFKSPVPGPLLLRRMNLDGDLQSDLTVHGGKNKAVYAYPSEHYDYWRTELPDMELTWGMFGENFTTEGLMEENAFIGDRFRIGGAAVKVAQPRLPCFKLGIRFGRADMVKRFCRQPALGNLFFGRRRGYGGRGRHVRAHPRRRTPHQHRGHQSRLRRSARKLRSGPPHREPGGASQRPARRIQPRCWPRSRNDFREISRYFVYFFERLFLEFVTVNVASARPSL